MVAAAYIDRFAIGGQSKRVRPVLATTAKSFEQDHVIELIIAIGILQAIETASLASIDANIETVESKQ
jgi:hypothetical protein